MSKEKYDSAFQKGLSIEGSIDENIKYNDRKWDSIAHMSLISEIEEGFKITMETDDIIALSSYQKGREILKKYGFEW